jgi:uncharacterized protein (DUF342 family)
MSDSGIAATTDIEKDNLEAHVELCWQRYQRFHDRLSRVEEKVDNLSDDVKSMREEYLTEIKALREETLKESRSVKTAIITSSATVIAGLIGLIAIIMNAPH